MKNRLIAILLCATMGIAVIACGESGGAMPKDEVQENEKDDITTAADKTGSEDTTSTEGGFPNLLDEEEGTQDSSASSDTESVFGDNGSVSDEAASYTEDAGLMSSSFYLNQYDESEDNNLYFMCYGNNILCTPQAKDKYPKLDKKLNEIAKDYEDFYNEQIEEQGEEAKEFAAERRKEGSEGCYSRYCETVLKRYDDRAVSILSVHNGYLGGAHPDYYYETFNIDPNTGELYKLSDIVKDKDKLDELLKNKLDGEYPDVEFFDIAETLKDFDMDLTETKDNGDDVTYAYDFTLDPDGICFYFDPYGVSAYAYGDQTVKILYDEEPDLFKEDFKIDGGFISYFPEFYQSCYDLKNDGVTERISLAQTDYEEGYDMYTALLVNEDAKELKVENTESFKVTPCLVHTDKGKDYMYAFTQGMDDIVTLYVVDLNGEEPERGGDTFKSFRWFMGEEDVYGDERPTDPDELIMAARIDLLSTYNGYFHCEIDKDGMPQMIDKYYTIPENTFVLKSKADLKTNVVDEDGEVVEGNVTVPAGEYYALYRTDGKKFVDAKLADGRIVRLFLQKSDDYVRTVNGQMDEYDLFETLYYAS